MTTRRVDDERLFGSAGTVIAIGRHVYGAIVGARGACARPARRHRSALRNQAAAVLVDPAVVFEPELDVDDVLDVDPLDDVDPPDDEESEPPAFDDADPLVLAALVSFDAASLSFARSFVAPDVVERLSVL